MSCGNKQQNCLSSDSGNRFQTELPLFWRCPNLLITQCRISRDYSLRDRNEFDPFSHFHGTPPCVKQTDTRHVLCYTYALHMHSMVKTTYAQIPMPKQCDFCSQKFCKQKNITNHACHLSEPVYTEGLKMMSRFNNPAKSLTDHRSFPSPTNIGTTVPPKNTFQSTSTETSAKIVNAARLVST